MCAGLSPRNSRLSELPRTKLRGSSFEVLLARIAIAKIVLLRAAFQRLRPACEKTLDLRSVSNHNCEIFEVNGKVVA